MELNFFDPSKMDSKELPMDKGIYFVVSKPNAALPFEMRELEYKSVCDTPVLYIGIASNLQRRDYRNHLMVPLEIQP